MVALQRPAAVKGPRFFDAVQTGSTVTPSYDSIDLREYRYHLYRYGAAGSADYKLSEGSNFYLRGLFSDLWMTATSGPTL